MVGKVKGTLLIARMRYLGAQGPDGAGRVLRRLTEEDRRLLGGELEPTTWYSAGVLQRLENTIAAILANGDRLRLYRDMGRFSAETNLGPSGVQRPYLREGDPQFLLRNVPMMYGTQHDTGRRDYVQTGPRSALLRTLEAEEASLDDCQTTAGWLERGIELSGGKAVRVEERTCRARGAPACEHHCEWS